MGDVGKIATHQQSSLLNPDAGLTLHPFLEGSLLSGRQVGRVPGLHPEALADDHQTTLLAKQQRPPVVPMDILNTGYR